MNNFFTLVSAATGCISIYDFASLLDIPIGIMISVIGLKIWAITAGTKKYEPIMKKKKKKYYKITLLQKVS